MLEIIFLCVLAGVIAGFLAGLFGVGGGLVIVPVLVTIFASQGFDSSIHMQLALGTSLTTIVVTGLSSVMAHHRKGAVDWLVVRRMVPGLVVGAWLGAALANWIPSESLKIAFGIGEILVALRLWIGGQPKAGRGFPGAVGLTAAATGIGSLSALAGIGGGTLTVPFLSWCNVQMQRAVATSSACGIPIALAGALGYAVAGWGQPVLPANTLGFIYWPAALGIVSASVLLAPLGAKLAHRWSAATLKKAFALLLLALGVKMLVG